MESFKLISVALLLVSSFSIYVIRSFERKRIPKEEQPGPVLREFHPTEQK